MDQDEDLSRTCEQVSVLRIHWLLQKDLRQSVVDQSHPNAHVQ